MELDCGGLSDVEFLEDVLDVDRKGRILLLWDGGL